MHHQRGTPRAVLLSLGLAACAHAAYQLSDAGGTGPKFDGVGAISGGGATSRFLQSYSPQTLSDILDFLFKPQFGASLHIFKVEIGGGALSSEGSEPTHMQNASDLNFARGYEWFLMQQAVARNPAIRLYGLPWTWPGWVGAGTGNPWGNITAAAEYVTQWVRGAEQVYNLTLDTVGVWNERVYSADYVKVLRQTLNAANYSNVKILCDDGHYLCVPDILNDPELAAAVTYVGGHGTPPAQAALTGKPVWFSEDFHSYGTDEGGATWSTQINRRYLDYNMTSTIAWNAVDSFYSGLAFDNTGLMRANSPWSGHYDVLAPIWATAHTTQFTAPGWFYLRTGSGAGMLTSGGSYVTYLSPSAWTLVIEKYVNSGDPVTRAENATFSLGGSLATLSPPGSKLYVWRSMFPLQPGEQEDYFAFVGTITPAADGTFSVMVDVDTTVTITTRGDGNKGSHATPPVATPFPMQYSDDFNSCAPPAEAPFWNDVSGSWECVDDTADPAHGVVMRLVTQEKPCVWEKDLLPHALIGDMNWADVNATVDMRIPSGAAALFGVRVTLLNASGYSALMNEESQSGLWLAVDLSTPGNPAFAVYASVLNVTTGYKPLLTGKLPASVTPATWHTYTLTSAGTALSAWVDGAAVFTGLDVSQYAYTGWVGFGATSYGPQIDWDNLAINAVAYNSRLAE